MASQSSLRISVLPGDGIGVEVTKACLALLERLMMRMDGLDLDLKIIEAGAACYERTGTALPEDAIESARAADAILFGAMGLPHIRYPDGREIAPQLDLRELFDLYAGVRPVRQLPGVKTVLADPRAAAIDFVLVRESTEGLFSHRLGNGELRDDRVTDLLEVTRRATERVVEFTFRLAAARAASGTPAKVTCIDKANVLPSMVFFRRVFDEVASRHSDIPSGHMYVDAAALNLVRRPWDLNVMVTENMFGDILSDLGAGLGGGMGLAPSADIGDAHAMFQPCHGSAPDIMGTGRANPVGMFLSAAMMFDWLAERHRHAACLAAGRILREAVDLAFSSGMVLPFELGGQDGLDAVTQGIMKAVDRLTG